MGDDQRSGLLEWSTQIGGEKRFGGALEESLWQAGLGFPRLLRSVVGQVFFPFLYCFRQAREQEHVQTNDKRSCCEEVIDDNEVAKRAD